MTRHRWRAKDTLLTRYPVLSLSVFSVAGLVSATALLFIHWWLGILLYAGTTAGCVGLIAWIIRQNTGEG
jgi:hypothetical protein